MYILNCYEEVQNMKDSFDFDVDIQESEKVEPRITLTRHNICTFTTPGYCGRTMSLSPCGGTIMCNTKSDCMV